MAAPAGAYRQTLNVINSAGAQIVHLPAILQIDKATMLARFYLDGMISIVTTQGDALLGYCRIGSGNYNMHNPSRHGSLRTYDAGECVLFNDAGLNTLAITNEMSVISSQIGVFKVQARFTSAFYVSTDAFGVRYQIHGADGASQWYEEVIYQAKGENTTFIEDILLTWVDDAYAFLNDTVTYTTFVINAEGRFNSPLLQSRKVDLIPIQLRVGSSDAAVSTFYTNNYALIPGDQDNDGILDYPYKTISKLYYKQQDGVYTPALAANYYPGTSPTFYYLVGGAGGSPDTNLIVRTVNTDNGGGQDAWTPWSYTAFAASSSAACAAARRRPDNTVTVYRFNQDQKLYIVQNTSTLVQDGYYVVKNAEGLFDIYYVVGGLNVEYQGTCPV